MIDDFTYDFTHYLKRDKDFYFDSLTMTDNPAIYTNETIPSQYIIEIDRAKNNEESFI